MARKTHSPKSRALNSPAIEAVLSTGFSVDDVDPTTGLSALHLAVGRDNLDIARYLVEQGASFTPDRQGRLPTTIAAECRVSKAMCDFIVEAEALADGV